MRGRRTIHVSSGIGMTTVALDSLQQSSRIIAAVYSILGKNEHTQLHSRSVGTVTNSFDWGCAMFLRGMRMIIVIFGVAPLARRSECSIRPVGRMDRRYVYANGLSSRHKVRFSRLVITRRRDKEVVIEHRDRSIHREPNVQRLDCGASPLHCCLLLFSGTLCVSFHLARCVDACRGE